MALLAAATHEDGAALPALAAGTVEAPDRTDTVVALVGFATGLVRLAADRCGLPASAVLEELGEAVAVAGA